MIEQLWPYLKYLFGFIGVVAVAEMYVSARWWPGYFMAGIPIYRRDLSAEGVGGDAPTAEEIEAALPESGWRTPIHVRAIGEHRFAFREAMRQVDIGYPPVMHGCIVFDPPAGEIRVRGFANSYAALFTCFFLLAPLAMPLELIDYIFPLFVLGLFACIYRIQARRFRQVADTAREVWCAKGQTNR